MPALLIQLRSQWHRVVVAALAIYSLFYSIRGALHVSPPSSMLPEDHRTFYFTYYAIGVVGPIIDLQRLFVAYRPSTRAAQLAFNIWSIITAIMVFSYFIDESFSFFLPGFKELVRNGTLSTEVAEEALRLSQSSPMLLPDQVTPLQSTTTPGLVETVWMGIVSLKPLVLHMVRGYALRTILNQRQQLDHEQEVRQEKQGHHILSGNSDLPAPIASASTVEGFKTEAELRRLRLRVPTWPRLIVGVWFLLKALIDVTQLSPSLQHYSVAEKLELAVSLLQGLAGLYILYRKSTHLTQWLFSTICVTTLYTQVTFSIRTWNPNMTKLDPPTKSLLNEEHASETELVFFHVMSIIMANIFFVMRLWVCWRLVVDLKARDARVARAKEQSRERGCAEKQQQGSLDGVVTDKPVNHSHS